MINKRKMHRVLAGIMAAALAMQSPATLLAQEVRTEQLLTEENVEITEDSGDGQEPDGKEEVEEQAATPSPEPMPTETPSEEIIPSVTPTPAAEPQEPAVTPEITPEAVVTPQVTPEEPQIWEEPQTPEEPQIWETPQVLDDAGSSEEIPEITEIPEKPEEELFSDRAGEQASEQITVTGNARADAQIIWQDHKGDTDHPLQPGNVLCTIKNADGAEIESKTISYGADGSLQRDPGLWDYLQWNDKEVPVVQLNKENNLNHRISLSGLPDKRTVITPEDDGEGNITETVTEEFISWELQVGAAPQDYLMAADEENHVYTMTPVTVFSAEVELRSGETVTDIEWQTIRDNLKVYGDGNELTDEAFANRFVPGTELPRINVIPDPNNPHKAVLEVVGLPWCTENKSEIVYSGAVGGQNGDTSIHSDGFFRILINDGSGDELIQSINNGRVPNFGDVTSVVHDGGLLVMQRYGEMQFTGTKVWLDDNAVNRPSARWALWRFTRGGSYQTASPVRDEHGQSVVTELDATANPVSVNFDGMELPKYDANGEAYVYFAKETMEGETAGSYEKVFGEPVQDEAGVYTGVDTSRDKAPNWFDGLEGYQDDEWSRGEDFCVYNGGTICNRRTGTVEVSQKKHWIASNYQDDLHHVQVSFVLQGRPVPKEPVQDPLAGWENIKDPDGNDITDSLQGFEAENMSGTIFATAPKYDEAGRELEYRWIETSVREELESGELSENLLQTDADGRQFFELSLNKENTHVDGREYYLSHSVTKEEEEKGTYPGCTAGDVVNQLVGTTRYDVRKIWDPGISPDAYPEYITIVLKQQSTKGEIKKYEYTLQNPKDGSSVWDLAITSLPGGGPLPKYDSDGGKYTYTVEEMSVSDNRQYTSDYEYNNRDTEVDVQDPDEESDVNNVEITNRPVGEGRQIRVRKIWLDDGDAAHRQPVQVAVYRRAANEGEEDRLIRTVILSEENQWWTYVGVTEYVVQADGKTYLAESREALWDMLKKDGVADAETLAKDSAVYDAADAYYISEVSMGADGAYPVRTEESQRSLRGYPSIAGADMYHGYEVFYANPNGEKTAGTAPDGEGYYTVFNRRVGQVDVDVTKKWIDGGKSAKEREEYQAKLVLNLNGSEVSYKTEGGRTGLSLGKDPYNHDFEYLQTIYDSNDADSRKEVPHKQLLTGGKDDGTDSETVSFYNMPKYDYYGRVLHYSVTEEDTDNALEKAEYVPSISVDQYDPVEGDRIFGKDGHDNQDVTVTNRRSAVKNVSFHKHWIDKAVYQEGHRPDIYLNLYRLDSTEACKNGPVRNDFVDHKWTEHKEHGDTDYKWTCTLDALPKYDANGAEITYYAQESTDGITKEFDYLDVQYASDEYGKSGFADGKASHVSWDEEAESYVVSHDIGSSDDAESWVLESAEENPVAVLREDGWFINELRSNILVQGKKVWQNIPEGFPCEELPELDFQLERKLKGTDTSEKIAEIRGVVSEALSFEFYFRYQGRNDKDGNPLDEENELIPSETAWERFLPKYNPADGALYEYSVKEEVPGNPGLDLTTAYEALPGEVHNYTITNTFNRIDGAGNEADLQIKKTWDSAHDEVPKESVSAEAVFELYRFYENKKGSDYSGVKGDSGELVDTVRVTREAPEANFGKQLVTAPNGKPYLYYVKERNIDGFESTGINISGAEEVAVNEDWDNCPAELKEKDDSRSAVFKFKRISTAGEQEEKAGTDVYETVSLTADNTYRLIPDKDETELIFSKLWKDNDNLNGTRPDSLTLELYRWADRQQGAHAENVIPKEKLGTLTVSRKDNGLEAQLALDKTSVGENIGKAKAELSGDWSDAQWKLEITDLDRYAPNGGEWKYQLKEINLPEGYSPNHKQETSIEKTEETDNGAGRMTLTSITNSSLTDLAVSKNWTQNSELQRLETTYALQVKEGENGSWQWAENYFRDKQPEFEFEKIMEANESSVVWTDLPDYTGRGNSSTQLFWRGVEVMIGENAVCFGDAETPYSKENLAGLSAYYSSEQPSELLYIPSQKDQTNISTAADSKWHTHESRVTNTPEGGVVSLRITKNWGGMDDGNVFLSRPQKDGKWIVDYLIFRRSEGSDQYEPVRDKNNRIYHVTVTGDNNIDTGSTVIRDLPKYDGKGAEYQYAAREVIAASAGSDTEWKTVDGDILFPGYDTAGNMDDPIMSEENGAAVYSSSVTNTLQVTDRAVTKIWEKDNSGIRPEMNEDAVKLMLWVRTDKKDSSWQKAEELWPDAGILLEPEFAQVQGKEDQWLYTFRNLPETAPDGSAYVYGVTEAVVSGYGEPVYSGTIEKTADGKTEILVMPEAENGQAAITNRASEIYLKKHGAASLLDIRNNSTVRLEVSGKDGNTKAYTAQWIQTRTDGTFTESIVVKKSGQTIYEAEISDPEAKLPVRGLPFGAYSIKETENPEGYLPLTEEYMFTLTAGENGTVRIDAVGPSQIIYEAETENVNDTLALNNQPTGFRLVKKDGNLPLADAEFTLEGRFPAYYGEKTAITLITDVNGEAKLSDQEFSEEGLAGLLITEEEYRLTETKAPDGYEKLTGTLTFHMEKDGHLIITDQTAGYTLSRDASAGAPQDMITVADTAITLSLKKQGRNDQPLKGAEFSLYSKASGDAEALLLAEKLITGDDGNLDITAGLGDKKLKVGGTYSLVETKAPNGYILPKDEKQRTLTFTVNDNGSAAFTEAAPMFTGDGSDCITVRNEPITLALYKVSAEDDGKKLAGAVFDLSRRTDADGNKWETVKTGLAFNADGKILIDEENLLIQGETYKLCETAALPGYQLPEKEADRTAVFTVKEDGTVVMDTENSAKDFCENTSTADEISLTFKNERTEFRLDKIDSETNASIVASDLELTVKDKAGKAVFIWKHTAEKSYELLNKTADSLYSELTIDGETGMICGLPDGIYTVQETKAPYGYLSVAEFDFALDKHNHLTVQDTASAELSKDQAGIQTLSVIDVPVRGHVMITKKLAGDNEVNRLEGVHFDLYRVNGAEDGTENLPENDPKDEKIAADLVTDKNGQWTSENNTEGFKSGSYYFVETRASADSRLDSAHYGFTIAGGGEKQPETVKLTVKNDIFEAALKLTKLDGETKEPISGDVEFRLVKVSDHADGVDYAHGVTATPYEQENGVTAEIGEDGTCTFTGLTKGTYHLKEVYARGYELTEAFEADVVIGEADCGKTVEVKAESEDNPRKHFIAVKGSLTEQGIENPRNTATVTLLKQDAQDDTILTEAEFKLQRQTAEENGEAVYEDCMTGIKTGYAYTYMGETADPEKTEDQSLKISGLPWGTYRLVETAPKDGYGNVHPQTGETVSCEFTIDRSSFDENNTAYLDAGTLVNAKTRLTLTKQGTDGTKTLEGAEFLITGERFAGSAEGETSVEAVTDEQGQLRLDGILAAGVEYTLKETLPPAGYELYEVELKFKLALDGTLEIVSGLAETPAEEKPGYQLILADRLNNELVLRNEPTVLEFVKRFAGDTVSAGVPGTEFTLAAQEGETLANGESSYSWVSGEAPEKLAALLVVNRTYTLTETKAPDGAMPVTEENQKKFTYSFRVDENGNLTEVEIAGNSETQGITTNEQRNLLTVWDAPTMLTLHKTGTDLDPEGTELLEGCTFSVTGVFAAGRYGAEGPQEAGEHTLMITTDQEDSGSRSLLGRLIVGNTYVLKETIAPEGYALGTEIRFTVTGSYIGEDGEEKLKLEIAGEDQNMGYEISVDKNGNPVILQRDYPVELNILKTDENGRALAGAEFTLIGEFAGEAGESTKTFETDEDGRIELSGILRESTVEKEYIYRLTETKAPEGYILFEEEIRFRMVTTQDEGGRKSKIELLSDEDADAAQEFVLTGEDEARTAVLTVKNVKEETPVVTPTPEGTITPLPNEGTITPIPYEGSGTGASSHDPESESSEGADTGDVTETLPYLLLMAAGGLGILITSRKRKKAK